MSERVNQHFVPKFYFRNFSKDGSTVCSLLLKDGRIIPRSPIRSQCSRNNFYGSKEIEELFSKLEMSHSAGINAALDIAYYDDEPPLTRMEFESLLHGVAFQRFRTAAEIAKSKDSRAAMYLELFKQFVKCEGGENAEKLIGHIEAGNIELNESDEATVLRTLEAGMNNWVGLSDLRMSVLRNHTDYPFIFSDAPVVFINSYCRDVKNRGVLGLLCQGLQVFFPLDPRTMLLLFDDAKYETSIGESNIFDVTIPSDVSQMNALQLHHGQNAVYFNDLRHADYVIDLWDSWRHSFRPVKDVFDPNSPFWVDGKPPEGQLFHTFEPQVNVQLSLSFMSSEFMKEADYVYQPRSKEIREYLRQKNRFDE